MQQPSNGLDFLTSIVQTATGELADPSKTQPNQGYPPNQNNLINQQPQGKYPTNQAVSSALMAQLNSLANSQTYNYMTTGTPAQLNSTPMNPAASSPAVQNQPTGMASGTNYNSLGQAAGSPRAVQHAQNNSSVNNQILHANMPISDVSNMSHKVYTPKAQNKQTGKHVPNILSKGTPPNTSAAVSQQAILLPANMGGKYIIVNNPGQAPQAVAMPQNATTATQQQVTQNMLQNASQQNQQVLVLPANYQQLMASAKAGQSSAVGNQHVNSPLQRGSAVQTLMPSKQQIKQSPVRQKPIQQKPKVQGTIMPRQQSPIPRAVSSPLQQKQQWQAARPNQIVKKNVAQAPISNSVYQMQNTQGLKSSDGVKIVRPAVQPRGILPKPASQQLAIGSHTVDANTDNKSSSSKLSHYPMVQNQLQNLQNLVTQQGAAGSLANTLRSSQQSQGNQATNNPMQTIQIGLSSSNLAPQSQPRTNVAFSNSFATVSSTPSSQPTNNVALQQLLQLSQAATHSDGNASISSPARISSAMQNSVPQQPVVQNRNQLTIKDQLLQQALTGSSRSQIYLQPQMHQASGSNDPNTDPARTSMIEKNVLNIINRQNANKQTANVQQQTVINAANNQANSSSTATISYQDGQNQPLQLFMPKQLTTAQLMELQQKLLAGNLMQKMQGVQPKLVTKTVGGVSAAESGSSVAKSNIVSVAGGGAPTFTWKQVPASGNSALGYQFVSSTEAGGSFVQVSTQGMQVFLKANPGISQLAGSNKQNVIMVSGTRSPQKLNLPILQGKGIGKDGTNVNLAQGIRIQNAGAANIVIKQLETSGQKTVLSEQQKAIQSKKLQQLLLQLTPAQRNLLLKKQQELVSKGLSVPLAKLILQVRQEQNIPRLVTKVCRYVLIIQVILSYSFSLFIVYCKLVTQQ